MLISTFSFIFYTWTISLIMQILGMIWLVPSKSNPLIDKGWALGRIITWLTISLIVWFIAFTGIPINTTLGVWLAVVLFGLTTIWKLIHHKQQLKHNLNQIKKFIITEEILFAFGLVFLTLVRGFNPHIQDLEKPMDAGFMASYLRSATFPAADMWLSGESINYYSFGHFLGSIQTRLLHLDITYTYNLILAIIMGLSLTLSFSIVINLIAVSSTEKISHLKAIVAGIVGTIFVVIGGNSHTAWYWLKNGNWQGYWYADATRFIENTIHEFPSYSFVVADIHAHVWDLPLVLSFLLIIIIWVNKLSKSVTPIKYSSSISQLLRQLTKKYHHLFLPSASIGLFIGIFAMTSAWDAMIYALFLAILGLLLIVNDYQKLLPLILSGGISVVTAIIVILPWFFNFETITEGITLVTQRSPIQDFLALWTGHLIVSFMACIMCIRLLLRSERKHNKANILIVCTMIITAGVLLLLPEVIYFKDIYSGHPRANTMFKLTYQAFILMGLVGGWLFGMISITIHNKLIKIGALGIICAILIAFLTFPFFAYPGYYGNFKNFQGIHGYQWLQEKYPSDYAAILWMQQNVSGQPSFLEAVGESYTDFARVSSYTGIPTVLGWRVHEWLWRGGFEIPGQRTEEVKTIYQQPLSGEAQEYLETYQVEYIFIGEKEYETYPELNLNQLTQIGEIVYSNGTTILLQLN